MTKAGARTFLLLALVVQFSQWSGEAGRSFPLWDGHEAVADYAARVKLPPTKSIDLGKGVSLDLVLIPAGKFIMGSEEPKKPSTTFEGAAWMLGFGVVSSILVVLIWAIKDYHNIYLTFSLRWLLVLMITGGLSVGGLARLWLARTESQRYQSELIAFNALPANEKPAHLVTLTQPFYMGKYTVTQAQYEAVMGNNPSHFKGAQLPVEMVSWDNVIAFCGKLKERLNDKTLDVRLPTEAQWEYACRAGSRTRFYSGDAVSDLDAVAWWGSNSGDKTHPVGQKKANAFGLYDMLGNVAQFCQDFFNEPYDNAKTTDPLNDKGSVRILRGGSWMHYSQICTAASRDISTQDEPNYTVGFRIIASPPPPH